MVQGCTIGRIFAAMKRGLFFALMALAISCAPRKVVYVPNSLPEPLSRPRNIIVMIGDGMGLTQISAGLYSNENRLNLERCTATGLITTHSARHLITDSAAGATAFACGCKTYNGAIARDQFKKPCQSLIDLADSARLATGVVVTCSITHATPAAFFSEAARRDQYEIIAEGFVAHPPDLLVGGGMAHFNRRKSDQRNLIDEAQKTGVTVFDSLQPFHSAENMPAKSPFWHFTADYEPVSVLDGRDYLPRVMDWAPQFLQQKSQYQSFFLLVEGSQIDWACHANDGRRAVAEMLDFDQAVGRALDFAEKDGHTLVIVTADHETGAMAIQDGSTVDSLELAFMSKGHSASMVPVFAFGPGAELFTGVYDNTDIFRRIRHAMGW